MFQLFVNRSVVRTIDGADHVRGSTNAAVTVVQYGDYLSDDSRDVAPAVDELLRRWEDQLRWVYRHFPWGGFGSLAWKAAEAAEAAGAQSRFWEMHACLLRHQGDLTDVHLAHYARQLGLDACRFSRDLADSVHAPAVHMQYDGGLRGGVERAPAVFVNGRPHRAHTLESLSASVARALLH